MHTHTHTHTDLRLSVFHALRHFQIINKITNSTQTSDRWIEYTGKIPGVTPLKSVELFQEKAIVITKQVISMKQMFVCELFHFCSKQKMSSLSVGQLILRSFR